MLTRLLLNQTPPEGTGGNTPPPAPAPAPAPPNPAVVTIPWEQFQQFQQAGQTLSQVQAAAAQAERDRVQALADKQAAEGQWKTAAQTLRDTHAGELKAAQDMGAGWEKRARTFARDTEVLGVLSGFKLNPGAAPQLMKLLGGALEAHPEGEGFAVRTATFQSAADYFKAELAKPEYAHFLAPSTQGGAGGGGGTPPPNPANPGAPANLGEAVAAAFKAQQASGPQPIGLRRSR
jgi:hypothetical protein